MRQTKDDVFDKVTTPRDPAIIWQDRGRSAIFSGCPATPSSSSTGSSPPEIAVGSQDPPHQIQTWPSTSGGEAPPPCPGPPHRRPEDASVPLTVVAVGTCRRSSAPNHLSAATASPATVTAHHSGCRGGKVASSYPWPVPAGTPSPPRHAAFGRRRLRRRRRRSRS